MKSQSKIALLVVLSLTVLAAAFQWQMSRKTAMSTDSTMDAARKNETVKQSEPTAGASSAAVDIKQTESPPQTLSDSTTNEIADKVRPFSVVPDGDDSESVVADDSASLDTTRRPVATDTDGAPEQPIVVPSSYPIADAEKYFIPKAQRSPGNLGGPPPLNFPGGPNDPNRAQPGTEGVFTPPPAPGQ